ncbi:MAG: DUF3742 family protein [Azoarcus sp.]|jgi:hypothetical protein|nr:DUF3742 family protein [Azoarcus sp.]
MTTTTKRLPAAKFVRIARWFGETWAHGERKATGALAARGLTPKATKVLIWAVKLALIGGLLFVAFWLAVAVAFLFIARPGGKKGVFVSTEDAEPEEFELRDGNAGVGVYDNHLDIRIS